MELCLVAGIELATAWGVIAFVLNYIPFIGPLIATIFATLFALVQSGSWQVCFAVFVSEFHPIRHWKLSRTADCRRRFVYVSIHRLLAVFFWSFLWGIAGAFIGLPIMIAILTICEQHKSTGWIALLLSGGQRKSN